MVEEKARGWNGPCVACLKFFGCWRLNLHESVVGGNCGHVELAIKRIMLVNPQLVNQYDDKGRRKTSDLFTRTQNKSENRYHSSIYTFHHGTFFTGIFREFYKLVCVCFLWCSGRTALSLAVKIGREDMVMHLLQGIRGHYSWIIRLCIRRFGISRVYGIWVTTVATACNA